VYCRLLINTVSGLTEVGFVRLMIRLYEGNFPGDGSEDDVALFNRGLPSVC
jgi:hypothetical protein